MRSIRDLLGIGPRMAAWGAPALALGILATVVWREQCRIILLPRAVSVSLGAVMLAAGLVLYASTARLLMGEVRKGVLVTGGPFAWCQNPLYAAFILLLIPAAALLADSWPILLVSPVLYAAFKLHIAQEYRELEAAFGEPYRAYRARTGELLPLPPHHAPTLQQRPH